LILEFAALILPAAVLRAPRRGPRRALARCRPGRSLLRVRQHLSRLSGELRTGPLKTKAGNRALPTPAQARSAPLARQQQQAADREAFGRAWQDTGLVSTTRSGRPVESRNLVRSFRRICDRDNLRVIKVHPLRQTTASLLKKLEVQGRSH